ncbi:hypothetical protein PGQ11_002808 [Apiospora arundinis]|uniref:Uncharacterized protein n=1 Tax=Apiospora arundinis TaxID=335852 RepID=A0ABR2J3R6_9PEZI
MADTTAALETAIKAHFGADNFHSSAVILGAIKIMEDVDDLLAMGFIFLKDEAPD